MKTITVINGAIISYSKNTRFPEHDYCVSKGVGGFGWTTWAQALHFAMHGVRA